MATNYKFGGSKVPGTEVNRLITDGTSTNPEKSIELGQTVELTDEEVARYRKSGLKFTKTDGEAEDNSGDGDETSPQTAAEQQQAQAATAQPGAELTTGRTSGRTK